LNATENKIYDKSNMPLSYPGMVAKLLGYTEESENTCLEIAEKTI
jgi:hypothetical protein